MSRDADAHASRLASVARKPAASGWEAQSQVRALAALAEMGEASPLSKDELGKLLEDVADAPPRGARGAQAQLAAIAALERLDVAPDAEAEKVRRLFDDRPDDELVDWEREWHPAAPDRTWLELDAHQTLGTRRRWYENLAEAGDL